MKLRCFSECTDADYHSFWFECSPRVLGIAPGTSGFLPAPASLPTKAVRVSLTSFSLFFRVHQWSSGFPLVPVSRNAGSAPPMESLAPPVFLRIGQRLSRGFDLPAKAFSPPGFLNLMTLSSAQHQPALFHAGSTLGISSLQSFSPTGAAVRRLRRHCPHVVVTSVLPPRLSPTFRFLGVLRARFAALRVPLAFRALLHTRVRHFVPVG